MLHTNYTSQTVKTKEFYLHNFIRWDEDRVGAVNMKS